MSQMQTELKTIDDQELASSGALTALLQREFKPQTEHARSEVEAALRTLAKHANAGSSPVTQDAVAKIKGVIAELDRKLGDQVNAILHHPQFQELEGSWRGLHHLVSNSETDAMLKIRVFNISKKELGKTLKRYKGTAWDQSPIFKKEYEDEFGRLGGEPFACIIGDYQFDHRPEDVETLAGMAQISAAAHAPFIASAGPSVFQMESWQELGNPRDLTKIATTPEYAAWRSLRDAEDSRYLGLTLPRFLARSPYGVKGEPVDEFEFEEDTGAGSSERFTWANAVYAMAVNINRSFKLYGWCSRIRGIESGGAVVGLPTYAFPTDDGGVDMTCPTEIAISDRREAELAKSGFIPLVHKKNSDFAAFIGAQSLHKPPGYDDPDATANAALGARLPYLFAVCRFAHYLKCIARDKVGSFQSVEDLQKMLHRWITQYVDGDPLHSSEETKARKPLAAAQIVVEEIDGEPGSYASKVFLRPHYQLEGLTVSLRLVSKLPAAKAAS